MQQAIAAIRFEPILPTILIIVLAVLAIAATALGVYVRARGALFRAAAFALLGFWLAGPTLIQETRQGLSDIALLVVDRSASMQVGTRTGLADHALVELKAEAARLPGLELRSVTVPESGRDGTLLWTAARAALADIPPNRLAGILAITDGQIHDLPARTPPGVPLHALIPASGEEWDRRVRVIEAPSYGIVGHMVDLRVVVEDLGPANLPPPGPATLTIQRDGAAPVTTDVPVGEIQTIPVDITREGLTLVKLATPGMPGEASALNNQTVVQINGVRDRLRVLLVSGEPNQGERTWRRLLKSDPAVDLVHFTILRPPEKDDTTPLNELALIAFPTRELFQDKLSGFDLIILDRFTDRGILPHVYLRNIADYVRHGGALLLTVGPEFAGSHSLDQTPLGDVLPAHASLNGDGVIDGEFVPKITELGARHPVTEDLAGPDFAAVAGSTPAWGPWYRAIAGEDVQGQVVMTGPHDTPLLILSHVDRGRAAMLMSDQIWLWSRGHKGGGPQAELLRRVAHWLMKEPELDEERLSARITAGRLLVERRAVDGHAAQTVTVTPPSGADRTLTLTPAGPGRASASAPASDAGVWQVSDGTHLAFAAAGLDNPLEYADLRATADHLRPLVTASGGGVAWLGHGTPALRRVGDTDNAAGSGWLGLRRRGAHLVTGVSSVHLLPAWLALPLLLGFIVAAWRREAT
jgi:uncharacterized membrane protein